MKMQKRKAKQTLIVIFLGENPLQKIHQMARKTSENISQEHQAV